MAREVHLPLLSRLPRSSHPAASRPYALVATVHRWIGICACLLAIAWFVSGLVMMYVEFPQLTPTGRLAGLRDIRWEAVTVSPDAALTAAGATEFPRELRLEMLVDEPVYRVLGQNGKARAVSGVDGRVIRGADRLLAARVAGQFAAGARVRSNGSLIRDQWTVTGTFDAHRPLHHFSADDAARTELYVSSATGEVVLVTTQTERVWNWVGSVAHWLYFTELRAHAPLWRQIILWLSAIALTGALCGLWLGIDQTRRSLRQGLATPFRGWMAWHHIGGLVGGVVLTTWVFSGWLSLDPPVPWRDRPDVDGTRRGLALYAGHTLPESGTTLSTVGSLVSHRARQARFTWIGGRSYIVLTDRHQRVTLIEGLRGKPLRLAASALRDAAAHLVPGASLQSWTLLEGEDSYWYSHHARRELPVWRAAFDDDSRTWIYIHPGTGAILARVTSGDRIDRWTFSALHRWDYRWLTLHRPAWDIVMWVLLLAGMLIAVSGTIIGWRHLRRPR